MLHMADEGTEDKQDKSSISLLAKHCYHFMTKNIEEYIPTFSHLKAKNIKINQGQNFKPFERSEFRGLCRPTIQIFKAPPEEPINNNKSIKKSNSSPVQVPKRNVKTNKVSNVVFQPNKDSDSVKAYVELFKNKRPGIRTKRIVEDAVQAYNATRDEQEAKRNVLRSKMVFKKESVSDSDLITRHRSELENSSVCAKQRRTVKIKNGQLPSKEFLERMRDFNNSKKIKEETKCISLETEPANKSVHTYNNENYRRTFSNDALPVVSLPKLKIRPVNRKEKTQCPMSIINITFQKLSDQKNEQTKSTSPQRNYCDDLYIQKVKKVAQNKILSNFYNGDKEQGHKVSHKYFNTKNDSINGGNNCYTSISSNFTKNVWEHPAKVENRSNSYRKGQEKYAKDLLHENTADEAVDKWHFMKSVNEAQETCKILNSLFTGSNNHKDFEELNKTLGTIENLTYSNRGILNSLKSSPVIKKQHMDTGSKLKKDGFQVLGDSILPNKFKLVKSTSEESIRKNNHCSNLTTDNFSCAREKSPSRWRSGEYITPSGIKSSAFSELRESRPSSNSSGEYFNKDNSINLYSEMLPKNLRNSRYQPLWKTSICK